MSRDIKFRIWDGNKEDWQMKDYSMVYNKNMEIIMPNSVVADVIASEREFRKKIDKLDRQKQVLDLIGIIAIIILMTMLMR